MNRQRHRHRSLRNKSQLLIGERLEPREVLVSDWQNPVNHLDVNNDTMVSPIDALLIINEINSRAGTRSGSGEVSQFTSLAAQSPFLDVNGDNVVSPIDALQVINWMNKGSAVEVGSNLNDTEQPAPLGPSSSTGSLSPIPETRLNARVEGTQEGTSVAVTTTGVVSVWASLGQDGSGWGVFGQQYLSDGSKAAGEFRVSSHTRDDQMNPRIDSFSDGRFVVVWESLEQDGSGYGVFARIFSANASAISGDIQINQTTSGTQRKPDVAVLSNGNFAVTWEGKGTRDPSREDSYGIFMRVLSPNGVGLTNEFRVNDQGHGYQEHPVIAAGLNGGFAVAWNGDGQEDNDGIYLRQFDDDGLRIGAEIPVNSYRRGDQRQPAIDSAANGRLIVAWASAGEDGSGWGVFAQQFWVDGSVLGGPVRTNQKTTGVQWQPDVAYVPDDGFVVAWEGRGFTDTDGVHFRRFNSLSQVTSDEMVVPTTIERNQRLIAIDPARNGFIASWSGFGPGDESGTFMRVFEIARPNSPPVVAPVSDVAIDEGELYSVKIAAEDPEGDAVLFSLDSKSKMLGIAIDASTGELSWTPSEVQGPGTYPVTVTVAQENRADLNDSVTFVITVLEASDSNQVPSFSKGSDVTVLEDSGTTSRLSWASNISPGRPSEIDQSVTFSTSVDLPSLFESTPSISPNGDLVFTAAPNAFGTAVVTVILRDNGGTEDGGQDQSAPQTFLINLTPVNDEPTFTKGPDQTVGTSDGEITIPSWATSITAGPQNELGQSTTFDVSSDLPSSFLTGPSVDSNGTLRFALSPTATGTVPVRVRLRDNGGISNGGVDTSAEQSFIISVSDNDVLREGDSFLAERRFPLTASGSTDSISFEIGPQFDRTDRTAAIEDTFLVHLVNRSSPTESLLDRGTPGTAIFSIAGGQIEYPPGLVRFDGQRVTIDLQGVSNRSQAELLFQLINSDDDTGTAVRLPKTIVYSESSDAASQRLSLDSRLAVAGAAVEVTSYTPLESVRAFVQNVRFDKTTSRYIAELRLRNDGAATGRRIIAMFPGLPDGVTLRNQTGQVAEGPYLNMEPAIPAGGLANGLYSDGIQIEFENPNLLRFALRPVVLSAGPNRVPEIASIAPLTVMPGGCAVINVAASDSDGDQLLFSIPSNQEVPNYELTAEGILTFKPTPGDLGGLAQKSFSVRVAVSDGLDSSEREVAVDVVRDAITTTRISGVLLDTANQPLAGIEVAVGQLQTTTDGSGRFTLDISSRLPQDDAIEFRGNNVLFDDGQPKYPFVAEKLPLMLGHDLFGNVNNAICRPVYLPILNVGTPVVPSTSTRVSQLLRSGEAPAVIDVAANSLFEKPKNPSDPLTSFSGRLGITEVPVDLTPAALPGNLFPDVVVTVQPAEMTFSASNPGRLTLPNRSNWPADTVMDLWSINPATGQFDDVGDGAVMSNGTVETTSGGVLNSSWHFFAPRDEALSQDRLDSNEDNSCNAAKATVESNSLVELHSGAVREQHVLASVAYGGVEHALTLNYDSTRANARPIVHFGYSNVQNDRPDDDYFLIAGLEFTRGDSVITVPGSTQQFNGMPEGQNFWRVGDGGDLEAALQGDLSKQPTGVYNYEITTGLMRYNPGDNLFSGARRTQESQVVVVNEAESPFGAGWTLGGLQSVVENPDGSVLVVGGDGGELWFKPTSSIPEHVFIPSKDRIYVVDGNGLRTLVPPNSGGLRDANEVAVGPDNRLYVTTTRGRIFKYNATTGDFLGTIGSDLGTIYGVAFDRDGFLVVGSQGRNLVKLDPTTGDIVATFAHGDMLSGAVIPVLGPDGYIYASGSGSNNVVRLDTRTGQSSVFIAAGSAGLTDPRDLKIGPDGNFYVASSDTNEILRYDGVTGAPIGDGVYLSGDRGWEPLGIAFAADGKVYVSSGRGDVARFDATSSEFEKTFKPSDGNLSFAPSDAVTSVRPAGQFIAPPGDYSDLRKLGRGTYQRVTKDGTVYDFNAMGKLASVTDTHGNAISFSYDGNSRIAEIRDTTFNQLTTFAYTQTGVTITDPAGRATVLEIDGANNLRKITDPDGTARRWGYDELHHLTSEVDKRGNREETVYDFAGRAKSSTRKDGSVMTFAPLQTRGLLPPEETSYAHTSTLQERKTPLAPKASMIVSQYSDGAGNVTTMRLDKAGQQVTAEDNVGKTSQSFRDHQNQPRTVVDARANRTHFAYDERGNLTQILDRVPGTMPPSIVVTDQGREAFAVDVLHGTATSLGFISTRMDDIAELPGVGLFGISQNRLYRYSAPDASVGSPIGTLGENLGEVVALAASPDGKLIAASDRLFEVNPTTGSATLIGSLAGNIAAGDIEFDAHGDLYFTNQNAELVRVNLATAATTVIGAVGFSDVLGLALGPDGLLYGTSGSKLLRIDTETGAGTQVYDLRQFDVGTIQGATFSRQPFEGTFPSIQTMEYEPTFNQLTKHTDALGHVTHFDVDPVSGNRLSTTVIVGAVDTPENGEQNDLKTQFEYYPSGLLKRVTDPELRKSLYEYDAVGHLLSVTVAEGTADVAVTGFEYDAATPAGRAGIVTATVDANQHRTTFVYDDLNRLRQITEPDPDGDGELESPVSEFDYDEAGNLESSKDAQGNVTTYAYDRLDRRVKTIGSDPDGAQESGEAPETTMTYDFAGNLSSVTDPLRHTINFEYDARHRRTKSIDPEGSEITFEYDLDNNLTELLDPEDNLTRYSYDIRNRLQSEIDPRGNARTYAFDLANNLTRVTDRVDRVTRFSYDESDRPTAELWLSSTGEIENEIRYEYDKTSNLQVVYDNQSSLEMTYDSQNRIDTVDNNGGLFDRGTPNAARVILDYGYDAMGNVRTVVDTIDGVPGATTGYDYDALDRLITLTQSATVQGNGLQNKRVDFAYNPLGQYESIKRSRILAGSELVATTSYTYDSLNRLDVMAHYGPTGFPIATYDLDYDTASRVSQITDTDGLHAYIYDDRDQLTGANHTAANGDNIANLPAEIYAYDENGNRKTATVDGKEVTYQTEQGNRLRADGNYTYSYDDEGNLLSQEEVNSGSQPIALREFAWDHRNRLVSVTDKNTAGETTQVVRFTYDAFDRRISKSVDTKTFDDATDAALVHFVYDGEDVILDLVDADGSAGNGRSALSQRYLHGPGIDQVMTQDNGAGEVSWMLPDQIGTPRDLVDESGGLQSHALYDSFGNASFVEAATVSTRFGFTGREFDIETGLMYFRARYYEPETGRFISNDPMGIRGAEPNASRYVHNRPIQYTDPFGLDDNLCSDPILEGSVMCQPSSPSRDESGAVSTPFINTDIVLLLPWGRLFGILQRAVGGVGSSTTATAIKEAISCGAPRGGFSLPTLGKSGARELAGRMGLPTVQAQAVNRAIGRATSTSGVKVTQNGPDVLVEIFRKGDDGFQVIESIIRVDGTKSVVQKAYDALGNLVHFHPK